MISLTDVVFSERKNLKIAACCKLHSTGEIQYLYSGSGFYDIAITLQLCEKFAEFLKQNDFKKLEIDPKECYLDTEHDVVITAVFKKISSIADEAFLKFKLMNLIESEI